MLCRPRRVEGKKGHTLVMFLSMGAPRLDVKRYYRLISELIYNRIVEPHCSLICQLSFQG